MDTFTFKTADTLIISIFVLYLGTITVAIANMDVITSQYGPSLKAFLVVSLIGACFIDFVNALVDQIFPWTANYAEYCPCNVQQTSSDSLK